MLQPQEPGVGRPHKVAVVGAGLVGSTFAYALMISGVAGEIVLIDKDAARAAGEAMDISHGVSFVRPVVVRAGVFEDCAGADVIVIAAGVAQKPGESRLDLIRRNVEVFREIIPQISHHAGDSILLVVTNPVDAMSYVTWRLSGLPAARVIGSGTVLDSSRLRYLLSVHCRVDPKNVHAYVIGEHGDSEVAVWSSVHLAGIRLDDYCPACSRACAAEERRRIFEEVRQAAYKIIERKGATYYGIGLSLVEIVESVVRDENSILTVSTLLEGYLGVSGLFLSVPVILNRQGVGRVLPLRFTADEEAGFRHSAEVVGGVIKELGL